eukprot:2494401-Rhodomonas_salina.1
MNASSTTHTLLKNRIMLVRCSEYKGMQVFKRKQPATSRIGNGAKQDYVECCGCELWGQQAW